LFPHMVRQAAQILAFTTLPAPFAGFGHCQ